MSLDGRKIEFRSVDGTWDGKVRIQYVFETQEEAFTWLGEHDPEKFWDLLEALENRAEDLKDNA